MQLNRARMQVIGNLSLELHSADLANFGRSQTISLVSRPKFAKNYESQTENPSVVVALPRIYESKRESIIFRHCEANRRFAKAIQKKQSARSANPCKSFCYFWLSPKVESLYSLVIARFGQRPNRSNPKTHKVTQ